MRVRILLQTKLFVAEDHIELLDTDPLPATAYYLVPKVFMTDEQVNQYQRKIMQVLRFKLQGQVDDVPYYVQVAP